MKNLSIYCSLLILAVLFSGCVATKQPPLTPDNRICSQNFTYNGSFLAGRTYKTFQEFPKVKKGEAFDRALEYVISDGWQIVSSDKGQGLISASQTVSYGNGQTVPLNIFVKALGSGGVKVSINYATPGGVTSPVDAVQDCFCAILAAINHD